MIISWSAWTDNDYLDMVLHINIEDEASYDYEHFILRFDNDDKPAQEH